MEAARRNPRNVHHTVRLAVPAAVTLLTLSGALARTIDIAAYTDKVKGAWVGQMAGVEWGAATECRYWHAMVPDTAVPVWSPTMIRNAYWNDDLYVEIPFMWALDSAGVTCGWDAFGACFKRLPGEMWAGNKAAKINLLAGINPPLSGSWQYNADCYAIDWQIESDHVGLVSPGMPMTAADLAWRAGHVVGHGDGVYGAVIVAAMTQAAFFADSLSQILQAGRTAAPSGTIYRAMVDSLFSWRSRYPDWRTTWQRFETFWGRLPHATGILSQSANNGYIWIGLLYGNGDFEASMRIAMQCGADSDCNPSNVGGILGTWLGFSRIPDQWKSGVQWTVSTFGAGTQLPAWNLQTLVDKTVSIARRVVTASGGSVSGSGTAETWTVPDQTFVPLIREQWASTDSLPAISARVAATNGLTVSFAANATDGHGIGEYQWFFGDLNYASGAAVTHTYRQPGTYEVICHANDTRGVTGWRTLRVTVDNGTGVGAQGLSRSPGARLFVRDGERTNGRIFDLRGRCLAGPGRGRTGHAAAAVVPGLQMNVHD